MGREPLDLKVIRKGYSVAELRAEADPMDMDELRELLVDAVKRDGRDEDQVADYEMQVRYAKDPSRLVTTFVTKNR